MFGVVVVFVKPQYISDSHYTVACLFKCSCLHVCVCFKRMSPYHCFMLCFVCLVYSGFIKCQRHKHVLTANIVLPVLLLSVTFSDNMVAT